MRKAERINLFDFTTPPMRAFHLTWVAFFLCFFAWFAIAPLMVVVRQELHLTPEQVGNTIIASVAITILARLLIGWLCDRYGPRLTYTWLLALGSLPVMGIGLARDYHTFLLLRLCIRAIGASFVITQYHTSLMFAPNCIGTANATTAGWGNQGGGMTQIVMPVLLAGFMSLGLGDFWSWRVAMIVPSVLMLAASVAYFFLTQDTPEGNFGDIERTRNVGGSKQSLRNFFAACRDRRVLTLALIYAACFGVEITIHNTAVLYFTDSFGASMRSAGLIVGGFGLLAVFARTLGGYISDVVNRQFGLKGRSMVISVSLFAEGLLLILFSRLGHLTFAIFTLILFGLFVHISCGATYAIIPFVNRRAVGSVAGIVGAGGNVGAVASGFLFRGGLDWHTALLVLGAIVVVCAGLSSMVRFVPQDDRAMDTSTVPELVPERVVITV